jgi:CheY-like chemotaxis protein
MVVAAPVPDTLRVVVIEDHRDLALSIKFALDALGHDALIAHDGPSGVAAVSEHAPHLVIVDIVMPKMDGWEVARAIRELPLPTQPRLVAISGYDAPDDRARSRAAGFEAHIVKPIAVDDLVRVVWPGN